MESKPIKDTLIGKLLGKAKGFLPERGVLGILKNVIDSDDNLSAEEKKEAHEALKSLYEAEVMDRDSARDREVGLAKAGKSDPMMLMVGVVSLILMVYVAYVIGFMPEVAETKSFMRFEGMIEGVVIGNIIAYYYGTSVRKNK